MELATSLLLPKLVAVVAVLAIAGAWTLLRKVVQALERMPGDSR